MADDARRLQEEEINSLKAIFFAEFEDNRERKKENKRRNKRISEGPDVAASPQLPQHSLGHDVLSSDFTIHVAVEELSSAAGVTFPEMNVDIRFKLPNGYPLHEKPTIEIAASNHVSNELVTQIRFELDKLAQERLSQNQPAIFDLVERARDIMRSFQENQKAAATRKKDEEERRWRDINEEALKRAQESKLGGFKNRPNSLAVAPVNEQVPQPPQISAAVTKLRVRSGSASFDDQKIPPSRYSLGPSHATANQEGVLSFLVQENMDSRSIEVRSLGPVKDAFLGERFGLQLAHSLNADFGGESTFLMLNGTYGVDPLTPLAQITKGIDAIEREVDALRQSLPNNASAWDKHLVRLLSFRSMPVSALEASFQLLFNFPGYGVFLSDLIAKQSAQLSLQTIRSISYQLAQGLQFLHNHNVLHKFIIPEMVFISLSHGATEHASLILSGLGKQIVETIPNAVRNKIIDSRLKFIRKFKESKKTDVLLYGCTIYYMITSGGYPNQFPVKHLTAANTPNESLLDFVNSCLAERENDRPAIAFLFQSPFLAPLTSGGMTPGGTIVDATAFGKITAAFKQQQEELEEEDSEFSSEESEYSGAPSDSSEAHAIEAEEYRTDSRLHKDFRILAILGKGGFGECFKAQNKLDGRLYAVKRVQLPTNDHLMNRMILREVKLLSRLNHDNIVRYFNAWQETVRVTRRRKKNDTLSPSSPRNTSSSKPDSVATPRSKAPALAPPGEDEASVSWGVHIQAPPPIKDTSSGSENDWDYDSEQDEGMSSDSDDSSSEEMSLFPQRLSSVQFSGNKHGTAAKVPQHGRSSIEFGDASDSSDIVQFERQSDSEANKNGGGGDAAEDAASGSSNSVDRTSMLLCLYIQMELCDSTLRQLIASGALFPHSNMVFVRQNEQGVLADCQKRAWVLFKQLCEGLAYIHKQGMVHRDLTPNNVFLTTDDRVKIGDFGLAMQRKQLAMRQNSLITVSPENLSAFAANVAGGGDPMTPSTGAFPDEAVVGTSFYISPEILQGSAYDQKTDLFSLGVILLEMFYYFETGSERASVLFNVQRADCREVTQHLPSPLVHNPILKRAVELVKQLTRRDPRERPSAEKILHSDLLPSPSELGDQQLAMLIKSIVSNNQSLEYKQLLSTIFSTSSSTLTQKDDFMYDCFLYNTKLPATEELASWKRNLIEKMVREFLSRFACRTAYWPMLIPQLKSQPNRIYSDSVEMESLLSSSGVPLSLPYDLRVAFARYLVRSNIYEFRRFEIGRVYRPARVDRGYPQERIELAVDLVAPLPDVSSQQPDSTTHSANLTSSCTVIAELVCILCDLNKQFVVAAQNMKMSTAAALGTKSAMKAAAAASQRKATSNLVINHLDLLRSILASLPVVSVNLEKIDAFLADVNQKLLAGGTAVSVPEMAQKNIHELVIGHFPETRSAIQDIKRVTLLLYQFLFAETEWTDVEALGNFARNFKKAPNAQIATQLARNALAQLKCVTGVVRTMYPSISVIITTNYMHQMSIYSAFTFRLENVIQMPATKTPNFITGPQSQQADTPKRQTLAIGGDYTRVLDVLRFAPEGPNPTQRICVGFSFDFETLVRLSSIGVGYPLLTMPFLGEVTVALFHSETVKNDERQSALVDMLRFCSQLRSAGFAVMPVLHKQAAALLDQTETYLSAHHPISRVIVLLKHDRPPLSAKSKENTSPSVKVTFDLYFRSSNAANPTDSRSIDVSNSSGDFSNVVMAIQELCSNATARLLRGVTSIGGVFDAIMSNVLMTGASIALGAQNTPMVEHTPVSGAENGSLGDLVLPKRQSSLPVPQSSSQAGSVTGQQQSNTLSGGFSAYTDILWLTEERLSMKERKRIEIQVVQTLSFKLKTFHPSAHVDILLLEVDSPCLATVASWLSLQVQQLANSISQHATPNNILSSISAWSASTSIGGDVERTVNERHARYRRYVEAKVPELVEHVANRMTSFYAQMFNSGSQGGSSAGMNQTSSSQFVTSKGLSSGATQTSVNVNSSSSSSSNLPPPVLVLYAIRDNGYQFIL